MIYLKNAQFKIQTFLYRSSTTQYVIKSDDIPSSTVRTLLPLKYKYCNASFQLVILLDRINDNNLYDRRGRVVPHSIPMNIFCTNPNRPECSSHLYELNSYECIH